LELFAGSLAPTDRVALEVTGNAAEIARIIEPHVARVVVVSPHDTGISRARAKTDRLDARTLARLLAAGELDAVWMPDEWTRAMRRRFAQRSQLVRARTRAKNEIHAVLIRRLKGRPPVTDVFSVAGRRWLAALELPDDEHETVAGCLRHVDFLDAEVTLLDQAIAREALRSDDVLRLMTVPGVSVITASTFVAAIGDVRRFASARKLVGYLGLDARVRQSGQGPARHGRITKQGSAPVRHVLVEAAWSPSGRLARCAPSTSASVSVAAPDVKDAPLARHGVMPEDELPLALGAVGLACEDVTTAVVTHLHPDHFHGAVHLTTSVLVNEAEWADAMCHSAAG
jgi:transposase